MLDLTVDWREAKDGGDARCLYAYVDPATGDVLYIGVADRCSVAERWNGHRGDGVFAFFEDQLGLEEWDTLVGDVELVAGMERLSPELLLDIETLLIRRLRPRGNKQMPEPRRPGMRFTCEGAWPLDRRVFVDRS